MTSAEADSALFECIPLYAQRILLVGRSEENAPVQLHARGLNTTSATADELRDGTLPFEPESFHCIIFFDLLASSEDLQEVLSNAEGLLHANGVILITCADRRRGRMRKKEATTPSADSDAGPDQIRATATEAGLEIYRSLAPSSIAPGTSAASFILVLTKKAYDPLAHVRALLSANRSTAAFEILECIPPVYLAKPEVKALVEAEKEVCVMALDALACDGNTLRRFQAGHAMFLEATWHVAHPVHAYLAHAEFWHQMGDNAMATSLLRSMNHATPVPAAREQLEDYAREPVHTREVMAVPEWKPPATMPRVLVVTEHIPNYGIDVLIEGLHAVLGSENVVEYPWKPSLHGESTEALGHYPVHFNLPGKPLDQDELVAQVSRGDFTFILFADIKMSCGVEAVRPMIGAAGDTPIFLVDAMDDFLDNRGDMLVYMDRDRVAGYFKREMLACHDYGPDVFPMPFAYSERNITSEPPTLEDRPDAVFWAGNRNYGTRRLYTEYLETKMDIDFDRRFPPREYYKQLQRNRIGLDIAGVGFDTVRYWEVPAHGCMLLAECRPTVIPHNFRDGETAVFFDDLPDLERKLEHYLTHPDECAAIAQAGRRHFMEHHTGTARARHLLGWIHHVLTR